MEFSERVLIWAVSGLWFGVLIDAGLVLWAAWRLMKRRQKAKDE